MLLDECGGRAKTASGYLSVCDAITMKGRVSSETWEAEMLCRRPTTRGRVFPSFDPDRHVRPFAGTAGETVVGVDFGFAAPFVALWVNVEGDRLHVVDEYLQPGRTLPEHVAELKARPHAARRIYCDPAGAAVNGHSGQSDVAVLRGAGFVVRHRPSRIAEGVELVRRLLSPADGSGARLLVDPRCVKLVAAMKAYRYPPTGGELPIKDGQHDHPVDALRYVLVNLLRPIGARMSRY